MRKNIVAGNWKMNKTLQEGIALAKELNETLASRSGKRFATLFSVEGIYKKEI